MKRTKEGWGKSEKNSVIGLTQYKCTCNLGQVGDEFGRVPIDGDDIIFGFRNETEDSGRY